MKIFKVEVTDELNELLGRASQAAGYGVEKFIAEILSRYVIDAHSIKGKDVAAGYAECGPMNLEIANL